MDTLEPIDPEQKSVKIINVKHKFAKKRFDDRYLWDPSTEIKAEIETTIFQK
jgi:hypothetical protein